MLTRSRRLAYRPQCDHDSLSGYSAPAGTYCIQASLSSRFQITAALWDRDVERCPLEDCQYDSEETQS